MEQKNKYKGRLGMRHKSASFELKEVSLDSSSRIISGYAAIFNNIDRAKDMLIKGCFSKSIQERGPESNANDKILLLWQHETDEPIGRITKLIEDDKGLYFEAEIDDIDLGDRAIKQLESGTINQFSIGYTYVWEKCEWDNDVDAFIVREVKLYEISVVTFGCNPETEYLGLKSADYDKQIQKFNQCVSDFSARMSSRKQQILQDIIAKAVLLSSYKPDACKEIPLVSTEASKPKSMFDNLKLK